jgi:hypothetical protein
MDKRRAQRIRRRITCDFVHDGQSHRGIVLDLSETGIFVQTVAAAALGDVLRVRLRAAGAEEIEFDAVVARRVSVPPQLTSVARGGLGLRVRRPPAAYFLLLGMDPGQAAMQGAPAATGVEEPPPRSTGSVPPPGPSPPAGRAPAAAKFAFRVRVKQCAGPRSRSLEVQADSEQDARWQACAVLGSGWEILSVEAV